MEAVSHNEFMYATSPDPPPPVRGSGTETKVVHAERGWFGSDDFCF